MRQVTIPQTLAGLAMLWFAISTAAAQDAADAAGKAAEIAVGENEIVVTGQESPDAEPALTEVLDVRVRDVEVVVTDKTGQPIVGLTRDDFELYEDGRPIELSNFFAVSSSSGGEEAAPAAATAPEPSPAAGREQRIVLFVDNLNLRPQSRKLLFESLRSYLREQSGLEIMLVTMNRRAEVVQPFTRDRDLIFAALDEIESQGSLHALYEGTRRVFLSRLERASLRRYMPPQGAEADLDFEDAIRVALDLSENVRTLAEERYQKVEATLEALGGLCDGLGGLAGRKALIYLSDGLPLRPADPLIEAWNGKYQNWVLENAGDIRRRSRFPHAVAAFERLSTSLGSSQFDLQSELNRLTARATDNRVTFYPISNSGRTTDFISAEHQGAAINDHGSMRRDMQVMENFTRDTSLMRMAEDTGGVAVLRNANLGRLLEQADRDLGSYYSLGYEPSSDGGDFRFHRLQVKVLRPGARVRYVKGYRAKSWRQSLGEKTTAAALFAVETNDLGVRLAPGEVTPEGDGFRVPIMVKIPFQRMRLVYQDRHYNAQLTVLVVVSDERDGLSRTRRFDLPIKIPAGRVLEVLPQVAAYPLELVIPRGPHRVAIGVRDHLAHTEAAVKYDLVVAAEGGG